MIGFSFLLSIEPIKLSRKNPEIIHTITGQNRPPKVVVKMPVF